MRHVNKDPNESEESKWLKSILPNSYLTSALETATNTLNLTSKVANPVPSSNKSNNMNESAEVYLQLLKEPNPDSTDPCQVMIVQINDKAFDCPGMISEEKVMKEFEASITVFKRDEFKGRQDGVKQKVKISEENDILDSSYGANIKVTNFLASEIGIDREETRSRNDGSVGKKIFIKDINIFNLLNV